MDAQVLLILQGMIDELDDAIALAQYKEAQTDGKIQLINRGR